MRRHLLWLVILAGTASSTMAAPAVQLTPEERAELTLRLRLIDVEVSQLLKDYGVAYGRLREQEVQLRVFNELLVNNSSFQKEVQQQAQRVQEAQEAVKVVREKLLELETERFRLLDRLGRKDVPESTGRADPTLEKILEVLLRIDKRLKALEERPAK